MSSRPPLAELPTRARVRVEVRRGSRIKRGSDGGIDFLSPIPCPFDYGSVLGEEGADGDPADAVLLGGPRVRGSVHELQVLGRVRFVDAGLQDDKWICGEGAPTEGERRELDRFFRAYARVKGLLAPARRLRGGPSGRTRFEGVEWR